MDRHLRSVACALALTVLVTAAALAADSGTVTESAIPDGVLCLTPVQDTSYIAVRFELNADQALVGVRWYNNDAGVLYPRILVAASTDEVAPNIEQSQAVLQEVRGETSAWSSKSLETPLATDGGALYVIFQLPANCEQVARGSGGGPGIGYLRQAQTSWVYLSPDGQEWSRMNADYQLLVEPILEDRQPGTKCLGATAITINERPVVTEGPRLESVYPNPSNPTTRVMFTVDRESPISLSVFDIRGRLVRRLLQEKVSPGTFMVEWKGDDDQGRHAASGVYFVQLRGDGEPSSERLVLVR